MGNLFIFFRTLILSFSLIGFSFIFASLALSAKKNIPSKNLYKATLLADAETGRILYQDRIHQENYPASLVKMMVALITIEEINSGRISLKDEVTISSWASRIGGHQVYLKQGEKFKLFELMKATIIGSANDAAVAVAEHVFGSDKAFIKRMNFRAKELGMKKTQFFSVHGLPPGRNQKIDVSSAYDFYLLALEILKHPKFLQWSSTRLDTFRNGSFQLLNTNHRLIKSYKGMQGMKTGYHRRAGFNLVSTAIRNGQRFISIVLGAKNSRIRSKTTKQLLDYGFENFRKYDLIMKGEETPFFAQLQGGVLEKVPLKVERTVSIMLSSLERKQLKILTNIPLKTKAPIKAKQRLGSIEYWLKGKMLNQVALKTEFGVPKQNIFFELTGIFTNLNDIN